MTEEEKERRREQKNATNEMLMRLASRPGKKVTDVLRHEDPRLSSYIKEVARHPDRHNLMEQMAVVRFIEMLKRHSYNQRKVAHFVRFYEECQFRGSSGPTRFRITPVQYFMAAVIYGLEVKERSQKIRINGEMQTRVTPAHRLIREFILYVPRKFAKTTFSAAVAVYDLFYGPSDAEVYMVANSGDQSTISYNEAAAVFDGWCPGLRIIRDKDKKLNKREIVFRDHKMGKNCFVKCLNNAPSRSDGLRPSTVVIDEYSQAVDTATKRGDAMKTVLATGFGPRLEPFMLITTTASDKLNGPFHSVDLPSYQAMLLGEEPWNDQLFPFLFMPDVDDEEGDETTWQKVQPHYGVTVTPEFYRYEYTEAQKSSQRMLDFRTKLLNVPCVDEKQTWIPSGAMHRAVIKGGWNIDTLDPSWDPPKAMAAVDLSESGDFAAYTLGIYIEEIRQIWTRTRYYLPDGVPLSDIDHHEKGLYDVSDEHPHGVIASEHENRFIYQRWVDAGWLTLTHGECIDYDAIADDVYRDASDDRIAMQNVGYDDFKATEFVNRLAALNGSSDGLTPFNQTWAAFTPACIFYKHALLTGMLYINDDPITLYCFANAVLDVDKMGNCKPIKLDPSKRVDGAQTNAMIGGMFVKMGHKSKRNDFDNE